MTKQTNPAAFDEDDAPELTPERARALRPAREVLSPAVMAHFKSKGGRPKSEAPKVQKTIRLSPEVLEHFRADQKGWQTRLDEALLQLVRGRPSAVRAPMRAAPKPALKRRG